MEDGLPDKLNYVYSCHLTNRIQIKIGTFEGKRERPDYTKLIDDPILKYSGLNQRDCSDLMIECQVFSQNTPVALPICTSYKPFNKRYNWNEWIILPVQFNDLPKDAQLAITVFDCGGPRRKVPIGGTTISFFSKYGLFRQGMFDLRVWPNKVADGNYPSTTPGKLDKNFNEKIQRLGKLVKKYRQGYMQRVDWLDRVAFRKLEHINENEKHRTNFYYLMIEFPTIVFEKKPHHIVYFEPESEEVRQFRSQADIVTVPDYEILKENLVESKHHKLARSLRSGYSDKDAKPNAIVRDLLHKIVSYPPTKQLSNEEQDQLWKFRFHLSTQKKALTKFLKCINWTQNSEVRQALTMLEIWAPMDVEDALELLSKNFTHPTVRRYAISKLKQAPDEDLLLYLLQLVQALKYENFDDINEAHKKIVNMVKAVLSKKKVKKDQTAETNNLNQSMISSQILTPNEIDQGSLTSVPTEEYAENSESSSNDAVVNKVDEEESQDLASFLIYRACKNSALANYLYWYLIIECEEGDPTVKQDVVVKEMYMKVKDMFYQKLVLGGSEWKRTLKILKRQEEFINKLVTLVKTVSSESGSRAKKEEKLQELLADPKFKLASFEPLPLPLDPEIQIKGISPTKASLFKSALMPMKLHFMTTDYSEYVAIFKHGDDLRQDQLILQMITLMDKLLRKENLDLKLTPYRVLATSSKHGILQFVNSHTMASVLTQYNGNLLNFFKKHHPAQNMYGIAPEVMDTYVKSCAGYCVITYLLGVGDRHLDNLLITENGNLFHIDFGYILGRDPKPLPPPMKLSKEMVEGMGGMNSDYYKSFKDHCHNTFLILRRHANLILNLFNLMVDANVPDIALEPDKAVKKVQDNLCLDLNDEAAIAHLQSLIDMSVTAVMAVLVEHIHKFAQYWRR